MGNNKKIRLKMVERYGPECMFKKANMGEATKRIKGAISYSEYIKRRGYSKSEIDELESTLTYHHLKHEAGGGPENIQNGALVSRLAHMYIHSLTRDQEEIINELFRKYKEDYDECKSRGIDYIPCEVVYEDFIDNLMVNAMPIVVQEKTLEEVKKTKKTKRKSKNQNKGGNNKRKSCKRPSTGDHGVR